MRSVNDADEIHDAVQLGWQCGYAYAGYYPESSHEQQQRAAHSDAEQLVEQQEDRQHFVEAWMQGVRAALTIDQGEQNDCKQLLPGEHRCYREDARSAESEDAE